MNSVVNPNCPGSLSSPARCPLYCGVRRICPPPPIHWAFPSVFIQCLTFIFGQEHKKKLKRARVICVSVVFPTTSFLSTALSLGSLYRRTSSKTRMVRQEHLSVRPTNTSMKMGSAEKFHGSSLPHRSVIILHQSSTLTRATGLFNLNVPGGAVPLYPRVQAIFFLLPKVNAIISLLLKMRCVHAMTITTCYRI